MSIKKPDFWEPWEFENFKLKKSLPEEIVSKECLSIDAEKCQSFLLTLGVIFNDFKGLMLLNDTMRDVYRSSDGAEISGHVGEKEGIHLQLLKLLLATLYEALVFMRESREVYESKYIQDLILKTPDETKIVWEMLNDVAQNKSIKHEQFKKFKYLLELLHRSRNNVGFHYQSHKKLNVEKLIDGYRKFFFEGIKGMSSEAREWAYRSAKNNQFNTSRYYYADAAIQGYYASLFGDERVAREHVDEAFELVNYIAYAIHDLLVERHSVLPNH